MSLDELPGVEDVDIARDENRVRLVYAAGVEPDIEAIKKTITDAGFTPGKANIATVP